MARKDPRPGGMPNDFVGHEPSSLLRRDKAYSHIGAWELDENNLWKSA